MKTRTAIDVALERATRAKRRCIRTAWGDGVLPMLRTGAILDSTDGLMQVHALVQETVSFGVAQATLADILAEQINFLKRQMTPSQQRKFCRFVQSQPVPASKKAAIF